MKKLIKNCKKGDSLYVAIYEPTKNYIFRVSITDIVRGDSYGIKPDVYKCEDSSGHKYEFEHENSDVHDSLIVDSDCAHLDHCDNKRVYTTYEAAVRFIEVMLESDIRDRLSRLEVLEEKNGPMINPLFIKKTKRHIEDYQKYKKIEIYDVSAYEDVTPDEIDAKLESRKIDVYKKYIETDHNGSIKGYVGKEFFVQSFDTVEEALEFIHKNDKSWYHGQRDMWFEGDTYFIKED